ncbi:MAG: hypothetical protein ACJ8M1_04920 [Chthoniobacterales bacterium]
MIRLVEPDSTNHDAFIVSTQVALSAEEKLGLLKQLDRWRGWTSLDDKRLCLGCGRLFSGHEVEVLNTGAENTTEVHCPTQGCQSIPLDWILPNRRDREMQD